MRINFTKLLLSAALLVTSTAAALAQPGGPMICNRTEGGGGGGCAGIISTISGPALPPGVHTITTQGQSTFNVINNVGCSWTLLASAWNGTGVHPTFGFASWSFDFTNPTGFSTVTPNGGPCFPATGLLRFWISGTLASLPGSNFRSLVEIQVRNPNLNTFNPHLCETYTLFNGPIPFTDLSGPPGNVAFTMTNLVVTLNN